MHFSSRQQLTPFTFYERISDSIEHLSAHVGDYLCAKGARRQWQEGHCLKSHLHASVNEWIVSCLSAGESDKENNANFANVRRSLDFNDLDHASTRPPTSKNITNRVNNNNNNKNILAELGFEVRENNKFDSAILK
jgi:hypothetical protein